MIDQYTRTSLILGRDKIEELNKKTVMVFGLGGVGGNCCDSLARAGIKNFIIVDNDVVNITNLNRQLIANLNTVGRKKIDVMEEHLNSINKDIKVKKLDMFYLPEVEIDFDGVDYVIDCIDTVTAKIDLICRCKEKNIPIISALGCGNRLDPTKVIITDLAKTEKDPLAKVLRYELRKKDIRHHDVIYSLEDPIPFKEEIFEDNKKVLGSTPFVPSVAGITVAYFVIRKFLNIF